MFFSVCLQQLTYDAWTGGLCLAESLSHSSVFSTEPFGPEYLNIAPFLSPEESWRPICLSALLRWGFSLPVLHYKGVGCLLFLFPVCPGDVRLPALAAGGCTQKNTGAAKGTGPTSTAEKNKEEKACRQSRTKGVASTQWALCCPQQPISAAARGKNWWEQNPCLCNIAQVSDKYISVTLKVRTLVRNTRGMTPEPGPAQPWGHHSGPWTFTRVGHYVESWDPNRKKRLKWLSDRIVSQNCRLAFSSYSFVHHYLTHSLSQLSSAKH